MCGCCRGKREIHHPSYNMDGVEIKAVRDWQGTSR